MKNYLVRASTSDRGITVCDDICIGFEEIKLEFGVTVVGVDVDVGLEARRYTAGSCTCLIVGDGCANDSTSCYERIDCLAISNRDSLEKHAVTDSFTG